MLHRQKQKQAEACKHSTLNFSGEFAGTANFYGLNG